MKFGGLGKLTDLDMAQWKSIPNFLAESMWTGDFANGAFDAAINDYGGELGRRFHPAIPFTAISRYTKEGETVWDPMSGFGTTYDIGTILGRNVIASDLHSLNANIIEADATRWNPGSESVDLVIVQPNYMNLHSDKWDAPMADTDSTAEFSMILSRCMDNIEHALKPGRVLCIVAGDIRLKGALMPVEYLVYDVMKTFNMFRMFGRVTCDYYVGKRKNYFAYKKYSLLKDGLFVIGRDTALFYQKAL